MNREKIVASLSAAENKCSGVKIIPPNRFDPGVSATLMINLLEKMYVQHGISNNEEKLISDIRDGSVLPWFATKDGKLVATAALVKQNGSWELGRGASIDQGNGIGKQVMLSAALHHIDNHGNIPLVAEVRAADKFEGIPSGIATQKICLGVLELTPHAIAPLFAHGEPLRNEPFLLASSDIKDNSTIKGRISDALNGRSTKGEIRRLKIIQKKPFNLIVPSDDGQDAVILTNETRRWLGSSLFVVEATDQNMPLIGMFASNPQVVISGTDRVSGESGKPVILIGSIGSGWDNHGNRALLAPGQISDIVPLKLKRELEEISSEFERIIHTLKPKSMLPNSGFCGSEY